MSTGRHATKRAARTEQKFIREQEDLLAKEDAKKIERERDLESQRINTLRARFGGQAPEETGSNPVPSTESNQGRNRKSQLPDRLTAASSRRQSVFDVMNRLPSRRTDGSLF